MNRIGTGYDVHPLVKGRPLIIGGVNIPFEKGLGGHSDADVLVHAIMDAMLGAAALGDIGEHFPDTEPAYFDVDSLELLGKVTDRLRNAGYNICNVDSIIIAQRPRMAEHIPQMRKNIAQVTSADLSRISIKATTTENMGFIGEGKGIAAQAVCSLMPAKTNSEGNR